MATARAQDIQLPTQAAAAAAGDTPVAGAPPADPFVPETAAATVALPPPAAGGDGWGPDLLMAGLLLLLVLLALAAVRILRLGEALRVAHEDELAALEEARALRRRLAAAGRPAADAGEAAQLGQRLAALLREREELQRTNRLLQGMVRCDTLTGLANGPFVARQLAKELRRAMRTRQPLGLILCDVDAFAAYNDTLGHEQGDALLKQIGAVLGAKFQRGGDLAARLDGDRFVVVMPETPREDVERLAAELVEIVAEANIPHGASPHGPTVSISTGVASTVSNKLAHPRQLLAEAAAALLEARRAAGKAPPAAEDAPRGASRKAGGGRAKPRAARSSKAAPRKIAAATPAGAPAPAPADEAGVSGALFPEQAAGNS